MIYINGIRASKKDLKRLVEEVRNGRAAIKSIRTTSKGATAITTEF
jgi:hypothetical protein